jgi:hypothetical protein
MDIPHEKSSLSHRVLVQTSGWSLTTDGIFICIIIMLVVLSWLPRMHGPLDLRWDGGVYYVLGTALAEGKGYRLLNEPGEIEAVQYPPLFPAIIAAHQLMLGTSDPFIVGPWLRLTFFLISLAYGVCSYLLLRIFLSPWYACGAVLMVLLNLFTNFLSDLCFAEMPFALVSIVFILCNRQGGRFYPVITAILAMATYLLRTIGIAVLIGWIFEALFRRQYRTTAIRAAIALIPVLAWNGYIYSVESSPSYKESAYLYQRAEYLFYNVSYTKNVSLRDPFSPELGKLSIEDLVKRSMHNLMQVPVSLGEGLSAKLWYWRKFTTTMLEPLYNIRGLWRVPNNAPDVILFALGCLIIAGMFGLFRQGEIFIPVYILLVMVAVCLTPWPEQWPRYLAPIIPLLAVALFRSVVAIGSYARIFPRAVKAARLVAGFLIGLVFLFQGLTLYRVYVHEMGQTAYLDRNGHVVTSRLFFYKKGGYRELDAGLDWLMAHAQSSDVVAASMPHWVYLRTGLKSVMPPFERDLETMQTLLDSVPVTYVLVDASSVNFTRDYTLPLLKRASDRWALVHTVDDPTPGPDRGGPLEIYRRITR